LIGVGRARGEDKSEGGLEIQGLMEAMERNCQRDFWVDGRRFSFSPESPVFGLLCIEISTKFLFQQEGML
jgi:hypothetical protein